MDAETVNGGAPQQCPDCKNLHGPEVMRTCGYYIGYWCDCGPYSRETSYFKTREEAERVLAEMKKGERTGSQPKELRDRKPVDRN